MNRFDIFKGRPNNRGLCEIDLRKKFLLESRIREEEEFRSRMIWEANKITGSETSPSISPSLIIDPDSMSFINASGINDPLEILAISNLVNSLKNSGLWNKLQIIYPFVGGTSTTCKFNLKNPIDTNGAFRLSFNGGYTFDKKLGIVPNGTNTWAETYYSFYRDSTGNFMNIGQVTSISTFVEETNAYPYSWGVYEGSTLYHNIYGIYGKLNFWSPSYRTDEFGIVRYGGSSSYSVYDFDNLPEKSPIDVYVGSISGKNSILYKSQTPADKYPLTSNLSGLTRYYSPSNTISLHGSKARNGTVSSTTLSKKAINFWAIGSSFTSQESSSLISIVKNFNSYLGRP